MIKILQMMLLFCTYRHQRQFTKVNFPIKEYKNRTLILRMILIFVF